MSEEPDRPLVFVCDDSWTIRQHLGAVLASIARVEAFESGEALLEAAAKTCPDLILSDVMMEGIDGYEVCRRVRADGRLVGVPVVLLTSTNAEDSKAVGLESGADDYLLKPVRPRELVARVSSLVRLRHAVLQLERSHTKLRHEIEERERVEGQLRLAQKLESLGRIAGGIAHEINTPIQFIGDSTHFLRDAAQDAALLYRTLLETLEGVLAGRLDVAAARAAIAEAQRVADLDFLVAEVPLAVERILEGSNRVSKIVRAMKEFAHPGQKEKASVDLNRTIESALAIATNEYKYVADLETSLGELPEVVCHAGELGQVVLNLTVNAAHAIADVVKDTGARGTISVKSWAEPGRVCFSISDTGCGIADQHRAKLFEPFFTTKEVGRGTGQGLALARAVVVDGHGGTISFESKVGAGTTFTIGLPLQPEEALATEAR